MKKNNKKNSKTTTAMVVYQPQPPVAQKHKKKKTSKTKKHGSEASAVRAYRAALLDPFTLDAQGARVPDFYAVATATRHITKVISISSTASGTFDIVILPSCRQHAISPSGSIVGGSTWTTGDGVSVSNGQITTSPTALAAQLTNYRIVGYGARVIGTGSMTNTSGKLIAATVPISSWVNDKTSPVGGQTSTINNSTATVAATLQAYGVPTASNVVDIANLPNLPNTVEVSALRVTEKALHIVPKITSPEAFQFRECQDSPGGFQIVNQSSVSNVQSGDASYLRVAGFEAIAIAGSGFPASSAIMDIEIIYHIEGNPFQGTSAIVGQDAAATFVNPGAWMSTIQSVAKQPAFRDLLEAGGNAIFPGLGSLATKFL